MTATPVPKNAPPGAPNVLPGWGHHTSFFQPRQAAFWLFVALLVPTGLAVLAEQLLMLDVFPAGWLLSIVLVALYAVPVAVAIYLLDHFEPEPVPLVVAAFVWGGVVAIGLSAPTNAAVIEIIAKLFGFDIAQEWGAAIVAPPVEETFKFLGVVLIYLIARNEIDDLYDGFVYGAMVGLGFGAIENVQYFVMAVAASGGGDQVGPVLEMFILRVIIVGAYMHVLWTGLAGIGLAYHVTQRHQPRRRRLPVAAGLFALAVIAHAVWNSPLLADLVSVGVGGPFAFGLIKGSPFFIFLALLIILARRREHHWFRVATADHIDDDVLTAAEVDELGSLRRRRRARQRAGQIKGPAAERLMGRLQREQINLAMIRTRTHSDYHADVLAQRDVIRAIRAELQALPELDRHPSMAPPAAFGAPVAPAPGWTPTHVVPASGMAAWEVPDPARPPDGAVPSGVWLQLLEARGAWAHVKAANGRHAWVDGRLLVPGP